MIYHVLQLRIAFMFNSCIHVRLVWCAGGEDAVRSSGRAELGSKMVAGSSARHLDTAHYIQMRNQMPAFIVFSSQLEASQSEEKTMRPLLLAGHPNQHSAMGSPPTLARLHWAGPQLARAPQHSQQPLDNATLMMMGHACKFTLALACD